MATPVVAAEFDAAAAIAAMKTKPARTERATRRSLNRAGTTGRAEMARLIAKDMGLKVGDAKNAVTLRQATPTELSVRLSASLRRLPLQDFQARQTRAGVSYRGQGGSRRTLKGAFIATMPKTGHVGVFMREGKKRLPIQERFGASVGHVFDRYRSQVIDVMREAFSKNLGSELKFASTEQNG